MTAEPFDLRRALVADLHAAGSPATASLIADSKAPETWADPATWICLREWREWPLLSEQVRAAIVAAAEPAPTCGLTVSGDRTCGRPATHSAEPDGERVYACAEHVTINPEWAWVPLGETPEGGSVEEWENPTNFVERVRQQPSPRGLLTQTRGFICARDAQWLGVIHAILEEPNDRMRALLLAHVGRVRG